MADHKSCKYYAVCDYRNDIGQCPDRCVQYKHKDDVRVVRCKDCKMAVVAIPPLVAEQKLVCTKSVNWRAVEPDHFCSYGERKDNGKK